MTADVRSRGLAARAFSVLELVIVMIVLAIVGAIAIPQFGKAGARYGADAAAARVAADLRLAQRAARTASAARQVSFNVSRASLTLPEVPHPDRPEVAYATALGGEPYRAEIVSLDVGGDSTLVFNGFGLPDSTAEIVVRRGVETRRVLVDTQGIVEIR